MLWYMLLIIDSSTHRGLICNILTVYYILKFNLRGIGSYVWGKVGV
jgi:hypothetical protein